MMAVGQESFSQPDGVQPGGYGKLFQTCGRIQFDLGQLTSDYHRGVHQNVGARLATSMDESVAAVAVQRKKVTAVKADLESCRKKYDQAVAKGKGVDTAQVAKDTAEADMQSALSAYSEGLNKFLAQDKQLGLPILDLVEEQVNYHKTALMLLEQVTPKLQAAYLDLGGKSNRVFGGNLPAEGVAPIILGCCAAINREGLDSEGIFRKQGSATKIRTLRANYSKGAADLSTAEGYGHDINAVAALIKIYFRELQEPLMLSSLCGSHPLRSSLEA